MFVDRVKVKVRAGSGGHGCTSFRRERFQPRGGPDGGDGGRGGDVCFVVSNDVQSLEALRYLNHYEAQNGRHGMGKKRAGRNGEPVILTVPPGTLVKDAEDDMAVLSDLDEVGMEFVVVKGGKGGRGNIHFSSSTNQAPRQHEEGAPGEERELELELKMVADIGLVGYPNAGKSTLLGAVSKAKPEVASYPFTTLSPHVGMVAFEDFFRMSIADIPGLIEGAHENIGLGHDFLRHIERTKVLVYVLDTPGIDDRKPWDDLASLQQELECYMPEMTQRPAIVVANKMDEPAAAENLEVLKGKTDMEILPASALLQENTGALLIRLRELLEGIQGGGRS